jgi:hypothetical protein
MFVSRRKFVELQAQLAESQAEYAALDRYHGQVYEEYLEVLESNQNWRYIYTEQRSEIHELYVENENLRSANYELMGYEADIDVPF